MPTHTSPHFDAVKRRFLRAFTEHSHSLPLLQWQGPMNPPGVYGFRSVRPRVSAYIYVIFVPDDGFVHEHIKLQQGAATIFLRPLEDGTLLCHGGSLPEGLKTLCSLEEGALTPHKLGVEALWPERERPEMRSLFHFVLQCCSGKDPDHVPIVS